MTVRHLELKTAWGDLVVVGGSRAGDGTLILLPQLKLALDAGRPHRSLPPLPTVCVSHGHMDHLGGLGYWASQRFLSAMGPGTVIAPDAIVPSLKDLLATFARLEGGRPYDVEIVPVTEGSRYALRRDMTIEFFTTDHWVPTLGSRLIWQRQRLRAELAGLSQNEIVRRRAAGEEITDIAEQPLLAYCADTGPGLFERHPEVFDTEVVLLECSFFRPADRHRAARFGHLHLEDLLPVMHRFSCRHLVMLHASRRHRLREAESLLAEAIDRSASPQVHHLFVDWE